MKLRAEFSCESGCFQFRQDTHFFEDRLIVGEQGFPNMEARKMFFLEHEHAFSRAGQKCGRSTSTGTATNNQRIIKILGHAFNEAQKGAAGKCGRKPIAGLRRDQAVFDLETILIRAIEIVRSDDSAVIKSAVW